MITVVLGTRPEIVKMAPVIHELKKRNMEHCVIHTGQHYSYALDKVFFENFQLKKPEYNLEIGSGTHGYQTGEMLKKIEGVLLEESPEIVLVEGDTNTVLAGALAATKLHIAVGHVEAGLRSFWREMPEEINRVLTDHISSPLFAPTEIAQKNLANEGITEGVHVVGNTIVDALYMNREKIEEIKRACILLTLHRQENADSKKRLKNILNGVEKVGEHFNTPILYPIHPRTKKNLKKFGINPKDNIQLVPPMDYFTFLSHLKNCNLVLTDSGGVQEEACILNTPCVTLRNNTERPETIEIGANVLVGSDPQKILDAAITMAQKKEKWKHPYGERVREKIVDIVEKYC